MPLTVLDTYGKGDGYDGTSFLETEEVDPNKIYKLHRDSQAGGFAEFLTSKGITIRQATKMFPGTRLTPHIDHELRAIARRHGYETREYNEEAVKLEQQKLDSVPDGPLIYQIPPNAEGYQQLANYLKTSVIIYCKDIRFRESPTYLENRYNPA
jgi:hypothetical protein